MTDRQACIDHLYRQRPQAPFVTGSIAVLAVVVLFSWLVGDFEPAQLMSARQQTNAARFLGELQPWPLQQDTAPTSFGVRVQVAGQWFGHMWQAKGAEAVATTLAISLVAILLAGLWGSLASLPAARNFARPRPFLAGGQRPSASRRLLWRGFFLATRTALMLIRALPEYIWAFLFLALLGPTAWPMVLALALHNTGILGKLTAEVVENIDTRPATALRGLGAGRLAIVTTALVPMTLSRFLLYFFYRWETCVREATILGMLGMASLGYWIVDARARNTYDEMMFFVVCGMILVLLGDVVSAFVRHVLRRA